MRERANDAKLLEYETRKTKGERKVRVFTRTDAFRLLTETMDIFDDQFYGYTRRLLTSLGLWPFHSPRYRKFVWMFALSLYVHAIVFQVTDKRSYFSVISYLLFLRYYQ